MSNFNKFFRAGSFTSTSLGHYSYVNLAVLIVSLVTCSYETNDTRITPNSSLKKCLISSLINISALTIRLYNDIS